MLCGLLCAAESVATERRRNPEHSETPTPGTPRAEFIQTTSCELVGIPFAASSRNYERTNKLDGGGAGSSGWVQKDCPIPHGKLSESLIGDPNAVLLFRSASARLAKPSGF